MRGTHGLYRNGRMVDPGPIRRAMCELFGHKPEGEVHPVYTNVPVHPPWPPTRQPDGSLSLQGVGYYMRLCSRCGKRIPIDETNAQRKQQVTAGVASVMNGTRAAYGLRPIDWED